MPTVCSPTLSRSFMSESIYYWRSSSIIGGTSIMGTSVLDGDEAAGCMLKAVAAI